MARDLDAEIMAHHAEIAQIQDGVYRLLVKFHDETDCGEAGDHWAECTAVAQAFGFPEWDEWGGSDAGDE